METEDEFLRRHDKQTRRIWIFAVLLFIELTCIALLLGQTFANSLFVSICAAVFISIFVGNMYTRDVARSKIKTG